MSKRKVISNILTYLVLGFVALITIVPLLYVFFASFKPNFEIMASPGTMIPKEPTFDNYIQAWNSDVMNILQMTFNSVVFTVFCTFFAIFSATTVGYVFARGEFKGKKTMIVVVTALLFLNLGGVNMYPTLNVLRLLKLNNSLWGLLVVKMFSISTVNIFLVRSYIKTISPSIDEAAILDGCGFISILWRIIVPLIKPIIATVGLLSFNSSWNDYIMPRLFTLSRPEQRTLIVGIMALKESSEGAVSWHLMLAGTAIALVPVLIVYIIGNKFFVQGITEGAVKG